jgi:hypothetical protein
MTKKLELEAVVDELTVGRSHGTPIVLVTPHPTKSPQNFFPVEIITFGEAEVLQQDGHRFALQEVGSSVGDGDAVAAAFARQLVR